jgi:superfamily II DNA or RNA helicase
MVATATFPPGARVVIRDEEWLVKGNKPISTGGIALSVVGLSELVRNHHAIFLSTLDDIRELKPEDTELVVDDTPRYRRSQLYLDTLLRRTPPTDEKIYRGQGGAFNPLNFQFKSAYQALSALHPSILIADAVGLGKTIEVGILLSELMKRGRGERILVIAVKSMLAQFQQEMWSRFTIPLVRLDTQGLQRVRNKIPSNKNPFHYFDKVIISIDTLKNDGRYRTFLEQTHWDAIVIDECHNVANADTQRNQLASLLSKTCDSLIMTSATPHNGNPETFANLMNMMDPTAVANPKDYTKDEIKGLFVRRFKKDVEEEAGENFRDREMKIHRIQASEIEEKVLEGIEALSFQAKKRGSSLFKITLLKAFLSSPHALAETIVHRVKNLEKELQEAKTDRIELKADIKSLNTLSDILAPVLKTHFTKLEKFKQELIQMGWTGKVKSPRVIVFSERITTLELLKDYLLNEFGLKDNVVDLFHAGLPDKRQQDIVDDFGKADTNVRIMLATDVASEGVNLHYLCHNMIHFDIPWSLIKMEQRNGRIDRYGQDKKPLIQYLMTISKNSQVKSDTRVLERLVEKEAFVHKNIGDAAIIMGLYNAQEEEKEVMKGVAGGKSPEEIIPEKPNDKHFLDLLLSQNDDPEPVDMLKTMPTLYADSIKYAKAAFAEMVQGDSGIQHPDFHKSNPSFTWVASKDFRQRAELLPWESKPKDGEYVLSSDKSVIQQAISDARKKTKEGDSSWPKIQLFWEQHPVMEWLSDGVLSKFGRHDAPVIVTPNLARDEYIYLFQGIMSNMRSQPVTVEWFGVEYQGESKKDISYLETLLKKTGFDGELTNPQTESKNLEKMQSQLNDAVIQGKDWMSTLNVDRGQALLQRIKIDEKRFKKWYEKSHAELKKWEAEEIKKYGKARKHIREQIEHQRNDVEKLSINRKKWLDETMKAVKAPYLKLVCVFTGN